MIGVVLGETKLILMIVCKQDNDDSGLDLDLKQSNKLSHLLPISGGSLKMIYITIVDT